MLLPMPQPKMTFELRAQIRTLAFLCPSCGVVATYRIAPGSYSFHCSNANCRRLWFIGLRVMYAAEGYGRRAKVPPPDVTFPRLQAATAHAMGARSHELVPVASVTASRDDDDSTP